jgi:arylsulfatase
VQSDPGEKMDVANRNPRVLQRLDAAYDAWWDSMQPQLINENAIPPKSNPFRDLYELQFGKVPAKTQK